jgi:type IV pilus assembly protein PilX
MIHCSPSLSRNRGISLLVVMVMLLLCSLLALGAARVGWLNEALVGNISDEQRAFMAAEELMRDAQRDIQNPDQRPLGIGVVHYPLDGPDLTRLQELLSADPMPCRNGMCFPEALNTLNGSGSTNWWQQELATVNAMRVSGALFGSVTGTQTANPLLVRNVPGTLNHYWIEVFPYTASGNTLATRTPPPSRPFIYRVTVVVDGLKNGTRVVLQSVMSP